MPELSEPQKRARDQKYAGAFYPQLTMMAHHFARQNPESSHAIMGACLRFAATLAKQIGMRENDWRGLAMAIFEDLP
jgi:hypothetical protein